MTKPIEWTTTENMPVIFWHRMHVDESGELRDATPADLSAALAAMPQKEAEQVVRDAGAQGSFAMQNAIIGDLRARLAKEEADSSDLRGIIGVLVDRIATGSHVTDPTWDDACLRSGRYREDYLAAHRNWEADEMRRDQKETELRSRAEKAERELADAGLERHGLRIKREDAERERDRMAREFGARPGELPDDGEIARVVRERAEFRDRVEKAERERDEARLGLARALKSNAPYSVAADEAIRDRDAALGERNRAQAERDTERACRLENEAELHRANKALGDLRTRLIAAETAAAQREPREYPLAEGSRWDGETVVDRTGTTVFLIAMGQTLANAVVSSTGNTGPFLADVLALAHRRGLL